MLQLYWILFLCSFPFIKSHKIQPCDLYSKLPESADGANVTILYERDPGTIKLINPMRCILESQKPEIYPCRFANFCHCVEQYLSLPQKHPASLIVLMRGETCTVTAVADLFQKRWPGIKGSLWLFDREQYAKDYQFDNWAIHMTLLPSRQMPLIELAHRIINKHFDIPGVPRYGYFDYYKGFRGRGLLIDNFYLISQVGSIVGVSTLFFCLACGMCCLTCTHAALIIEDYDYRRDVLQDRQFQRQFRALPADDHEPSHVDNSEIRTALSGTSLRSDRTQNSLTDAAEPLLSHLQQSQDSPSKKPKTESNA